MVNASNVGVEWEEPFSPANFPILNYTVQVINQTSNDLLVVEEIAAHPRSYNYTRTVPPSCFGIVFLVIATNAVGDSIEGLARGKFPAGMQVQ